MKSQLTPSFMIVSAPLTCTLSNPTKPESVSNHVSIDKLIQDLNRNDPEDVDDNVIYNKTTSVPK